MKFQKADKNLFPSPDIPESDDILSRISFDEIFLLILIILLLSEGVNDDIFIILLIYLLL